MGRTSFRTCTDMSNNSMFSNFAISSFQAIARTWVLDTEVSVFSFIVLFKFLCRVLLVARNQSPHVS